MRPKSEHVRGPRLHEALVRADDVAAAPQTDLDVM